MIETTVYDNKKQELNYYFESLKLIDNLSDQQPDLYGKLIEIFKKKSVDTHDFMQILKSVSYIIMYSLIESTIRELIGIIYKAINTSNLRYDELLDKIQALWEKHQFLHLDESNSSKTENYKKEAHHCISFVIKKEKVSFDSNNFKISGNADFESILKATKEMGINFNTKILESSNKNLYNELYTIKHNRNGLAHGSIPFTSLGSSKSIDELQKTSVHVEAYLDQLKKDVNDYIKNKDFKKK